MTGERIKILDLSSKEKGGRSRVPLFGLYIANQTEAYQTIVSFSVAGAIMGITLGSAASFVFYILKFKIQGDGIPEEYYRNSVEARSKRETFNILLFSNRLPKFSVSSFNNSFVCRCKFIYLFLNRI